MEEVETKSIEQYLDELEKGIKSFDSKFEPFNAQYQTMKERVDALETKMNTPEGAAASPDVKDIEAEWDKAYYKYLIGGRGYDQDYYVNQVKDYAPEKVKLLASDVLTTGGYFMPPTRSSRIIERLLLLDPFRAAASVETLNVGDTLEFVTETGAVLAGWTSERAARTATLNETFGLISIPTHPMYAMPQLTQKMARQASFDVEAWHQRRVAEYFAQIEGVAFIAGTGVGQPEGIRTRCTAQIGTRTVPSGAATTIPDYNCVMDVQDTLADKYQTNASWVMSRGSKNTLRKMQDGMGHYLLEPSITAGQPDTMLGKPVIYMPSMPAPAMLTGIYTAHDIALIYGDFKQAYQIVDIPGMITIRDDITTKGQISLYVERMGVGGMVVDDLAYVGLEVDTT